MPRGRGGKRTGTPGVSYGNRLDLNKTRTLPVQAVGGQTYGTRKAQEDAQKVVPLGRGPQQMGPGDVGGQGGGGGGMGAIAAAPLDGPTMRPDEPMTAGVDMGAGPGSEILPGGGQGAADDVMMRLRALYRQYPTEDVRALIEEMEGSR